MGVDIDNIGGDVSGNIARGNVEIHQHDAPELRERIVKLEQALAAQREGLGGLMSEAEIKVQLAPLQQQIAALQAELANRMSDIPPAVRLILVDPRPSTNGFSQNYLASTILPYLDALTQIQHVIDEIHERLPSEIRILNIHYGSVTVDITGGIRDTVELILDNVVKWRRENKKKLVEYETLKKRIEIEQAKAALTAETKQAPEQIRLLRAQAQKQELENQKMQLEIVKLALDMVDQIKPNLPDEQRLLYAMKMVDPTRLIAMSPLDLTDVDEVVAEPDIQPEEDSDEKDSKESVND